DCEQPKTSCLTEKTSCLPEKTSCLPEKTSCLTEKTSCLTEKTSCLTEKTSCLTEKTSCLPEKTSCLTEKTSCLYDVLMCAECAVSFTPPTSSPTASTMLQCRLVGQASPGSRGASAASRHTPGPGQWSSGSAPSPPGSSSTGLV
uniref:Uncharacterized protein n=1 Tax=Esox lucius TaxID=8010 RepID=A0A3P8ZGT9_ESOLU